MKREMGKRCMLHPGGRELTERLLAYMERYRAEWRERSLRVLDIGCGEGAGIRFLLERKPQWAVWGVDPVCGGSEEEGIPSGRILPGTAEDLPFEDGTFDVLLLECSFSRVSDPRLALNEMMRVMHPEGMILMSDLYRRTAGERESRPPACAENRAEREMSGGENTSRLRVGALRTSREIYEMLEDAGFHVLELQDVSRVLGEMTAQAILDGTCGELEEALGWPLTELRRIRCGYYLCATERSRLGDMVRYAAENSRYYASKYGEYPGLSRGAFETGRVAGLAEADAGDGGLSRGRPIPERRLLPELPFIQPEDIRRSPEDLWCVSPKEISRIITLKSSGSTGSNKRIAFSREDLNRTARFFSYGIRSLVEPGYRVMVFMPGDHHDTVGGLLKDGLSALPAEVTVYGFITDTEDAAAAARGMDSLIGVPAQMRQLCLRHPELRPKTVLLSADYVPEKTIRQMESLWKCRVFTHWGMSETGYGGGVQCRAREAYHLRDDDLLAEIIDPVTGEALPDGAEGELVITTLRREAMPLIRYRTGDLARIVTEPCGCGCLKPRLGKVMGRVSEAVFTRDGTVLSMPKLDEILGDLEGLEDFSAEWSEKKNLLTVILPEPAEDPARAPGHMLADAVSRRLTEALRGSAGVEVRTGNVSLSTGAAKRQIRRTE